MRVVFLARNLAAGGAERALLHLVNRADGFTPVLALLQKRGRLLRELDPGVPLFDLSKGAREPSTHDGPRPDADASLDEDEDVSGGPLRLLIESFRLKRLVVATDADVVSTFLMRSHLIGLVAQTVFRMRAPVVLNIHVIVTQSAPFLYPSPLTRRLMKFFVRRLFPRADRIFVVTRAVKEDLVEHYGLPESKVQVIHNAIDLSAIRRSAMADPGLPARFADGPLVVAVGRLVHLKGYDLLLRAVAGLDSPSRIGVVIIGEGPEHSALLGLARELGIGDRVLVPGYTPNPWKYMARADVLALPSRTEAFPNVIGEALALGVPIVASRCSEGVAEYLLGGEVGLLVAPESVEALRDGLATVLGDARVRGRIAAGGAKRLEGFDVTRAVPAYGKALAIAAGDGARGS
ncbi:MAG: glycosyltransferase [Gemmatimonadota bacterium]